MDDPGPAHDPDPAPPAESPSAAAPGTEGSPPAIEPLDYGGLPEDPRKALIYAESVRLLEMQAASLDELRVRTGTLLAAGSLSSSLLGAWVLDQHGLTPPALAALILTSLALVCCLLILKPWSGWCFGHDPIALLDVYIDGDTPRSVRGLHELLARKNGQHWKKNAERLGLMFWSFEVGAVLVVASLVLWIVETVRLN